MKKLILAAVLIASSSSLFAGETITNNTSIVLNPEIPTHVDLPSPDLGPLEEMLKKFLKKN